MDKIICLIPLIPLRKEPNHRSEMVSQLLFGEKAEIINLSKDWAEIKTKFDSYQGWIELKSAAPFDSKPDSREWTITSKPITSIKKADDILFIPFGSEIPLPDEANFFKLNSEIYKIDDDYKKAAKNKSLTETASKFLNAPYLWGGRTIFGIDCSGFTQLLYKSIGIPLPRDAKDQAGKGKLVESVKDSLPGDLLFFENENGLIVHVGMLIQENTIIHSSVFVRTDRVDDHGIYNEKKNNYSHKLKMIRRLVT